METLSKLLSYLQGAVKSLTIWFNSVGIVLLSVALADPYVKNFLLDNHLMWVLAVGNILLRFKTKNSLKDKVSVGKD